MIEVISTLIPLVLFAIGTIGLAQYGMNALESRRAAKWSRLTHS